MLLFVPALVWCGLEEEIRRIHAHLLIDDTPSALVEAEQLFERYPDSKEAGSCLIEALAASGFEEKAAQTWNFLSEKHPNLIADRHLLEELSWGVLRKGCQSTQYGVRLTSLVGVYLTRDARALPIFLRMMRDSNAVVRSVAIQMSAAFCDAPLKDEIRRLMTEEKVWVVRLAVIQAAGALRMKELTPQLQAIVESDRSTYEERHLAITALLNMYEKISLEKLHALTKDKRAGIRHLACSIAAHFDMEGAEKAILGLVSDPNSQVRVAALNAFGTLYRKKSDPSKLQEVLTRAMEDNDPAVAITAAWVALLTEHETAAAHLEKWLSDPFAETRRLAAAAISASGAYGVELACQMLEKSSDPYVQVNLAFGLLGQRQEVRRASDLIYAFLQKEKRPWMWDTQRNPLFQVLAPSQVRYVDHVPNYPEAIDQMTRLNLVSLLALVEDERAVPALRNFLQKKNWGITGVAAATLLQEGDESSLELVKGLLHDSDANVRLQACLVLAMMGRDESVLYELQGAYAGSDHEKKFHILEALGRISSPASHSFLIALLREPFPMLRVAAAAALIQSLNH